MSPKKARQNPIRVLVVDDSLAVRQLLITLFQDAGDLHVVGATNNGQDAVRLAQRLKPDVITMDITMPGMSGLEATRQIMHQSPTPIVVVSGGLGRSDVDLAFEAMQAGALSAVQLPEMNNSQSCEELIQAVRLMAEVPVVRRWRSGIGAATTAQPAVNATRLKESQVVQLVGIASSTGGPAVLATILKLLPDSFPIPILIVQHIASGFGAGLADWLNSQTSLLVKLAIPGDVPQPGSVLLAPDSQHMHLNAQGAVELYREKTTPPGKPYLSARPAVVCPSADVLFHSLAQFYGPRALGIILTGMGSDGAEGLEALHHAGGLTIAQNEQSCVVYGMPHEAVKRKAVDQVLSPEQIAAVLNRFTPQPDKGGAQ